MKFTIVVERHETDRMPESPITITFDIFSPPDIVEAFRGMARMIEELAPEHFKPRELD
jgi:hypothetical protein